MPHVRLVSNLQSNYILFLFYFKNTNQIAVYTHAYLLLNKLVIYLLTLISTHSNKSGGINTVPFYYSNNATGNFKQSIFW